MQCLKHGGALKRVALAFAVLGLIAACGDARSATSPEIHVHPASANAATLPSGAEQQALVVLSDAPMLDQTGAERRLKSDVIGSRIVVVDFIFTSCQTICPVTTALLAQAKDRLADIPADDLVFVSLSVDSRIDTPERLAAFAASKGAYWTFLTGDKPVMDEALTWLNAYATNPENHAAMILIGDASTEKFSRIYGMPDPVFVERRVRDLAAARSEGTSHHAH
ncbi:MAG: SCO family protein [Hyphomonas sp.]|nr:SCO family protein [Hyphomonas sp.]